MSRTIRALHTPRAMHHFISCGCVACFCLASWATAAEIVVDNVDVTPTVAEPAEGLVAAEESSPPPPATPRVAAIAADGERVIADVAKDYARNNSPRPSKFHGVTPGVSSREKLLESWGEPDAIAEASRGEITGEVLAFELKPFRRVEALVEDDLVSVVRVTLAEETTVAQLAGRLRLEEIDGVDVVDPDTSELLAVMFPEKGLTLLIQPTSAASTDSETAGVSHLVLEPIDARAFVLRAEQRAPLELTDRLADLRLATEVDPTDAHAHWLAARTHLAAGQAGPAKTAAEAALELDDKNPAFRVEYAKALVAAGKLDQAVVETRRVLDAPNAAKIARAEALLLMGKLAARGDSKLSGKVIGFHNAAISLADELATSDDLIERHAAKKVLVTAHLEIAKAVATRDYADEEEAVAQWVSRASGLAEDWIANDDGGLEHRLQVASSALAAIAEIRPTKDPTPWLEEANETATDLLASHSDPLFRAAVHWELGLAHQQAVRVEHLRGKSDQALAYGSVAIRELAAGAEPRTSSPTAERTVGELYFYLGAVNAVHKQDHEEAVGWYDRGREILLSDEIESEYVIPRRTGEELVSMGVSYWENNQRDLAVDLTEAGARMMERGVTAGVIKESALGVPYGNLKSMYEARENVAKAAEYGRLARGVRAEVEVKPSVPVTKPEPVEEKIVQKQAPAKPKQRVAPQQAIPEPEPQAEERVARKLGRPTPRRTMLR